MKSKNSFLWIPLYLSFNAFGMEITTQSTVEKKQHWHLDQEYLQHMSITPTYYDIRKKFFAAHAGNYKATIHDIKTNEEVTSFPHAQWIWSVSFDPTGKYLATGSIDRTIRIFDIHDKQEVDSINLDESVTGVGFDNNGRLLAQTRTGRTYAFKKHTTKIEQKILEELITAYSPSTTDSYESCNPHSADPLLIALASQFNLDQTQLATVWNTLETNKRITLCQIASAKITVWNILTEDEKKALFELICKNNK